MSPFKKVKHLPWPLRWLIVLVLRLWRLTLRLRIVDAHGEYERALHGAPRIYAIWHNRLLLIPVVAPKKTRRRIVFLASRSRDGGYIADVLQAFGMRAVRGSSSKGGASALRQMAGLLTENYHVAVTPDGPRGPRYAVQNGILWLAAKSGCAIIPIALNSPRHKELRGWDRTQLPLPFSRLELTFGEAIHIAPNPDDTALEDARQRVRQALMAITHYDHDA